MLFLITASGAGTDQPTCARDQGAPSRVFACLKRFTWGWHVIIYRPSTMGNSELVNDLQKLRFHFSEMISHSSPGASFRGTLHYRNHCSSHDEVPLSSASALRDIIIYSRTNLQMEKCRQSVVRARGSGSDPDQDWIVMCEWLTSVCLFMKQ